MVNLKAKLVELIGSLRPTSSLIVQKKTKDGTEATRVVDRQGRSTTADLDANGLIHNSIKGTASKGEADSLIPCKILVERLNMNSDHWGTPARRTGEEDGTDCVASNGTQELRMQVTRVPIKEVRQKLATSGNAEYDATIEQQVSHLREAVRKKETYPSEQRRMITLVIDAVDFPSYTYPTVVKSFREKYLIEIRTLVFKAIWLIGPTVEMTAHLDTESF